MISFYLLFGFSHRRTVCRRALARYFGMLEQLASQGWLIRAIHLSVDHERDTPEIRRIWPQPYPAFLA